MTSSSVCFALFCSDLNCNIKFRSCIYHIELTFWVSLCGLGRLLAKRFSLKIIIHCLAFVRAIQVGPDTAYYEWTI